MGRYPIEPNVLPTTATIEDVYRAPIRLAELWEKNGGELGPPDPVKYLILLIEVMHTLP